jgi:hypothetical protein
MTQLHRFHDIPLGDQLEPIGDKVMHRAFPLTVGVATLQAAVCLRSRLFGLVRLIDFAKLLFADLCRYFFRPLTANIDKLKIVLQTVSHFTTSSGTRRWGRYRS